MTELEQLKEQRKEINKRIRELEHPKFEVDGAKLYWQHYSGPKDDEWSIVLRCVDPNSSNPELCNRKVTIAHATSKEQAISCLSTQIATLQNLYKVVTGEEYEEKSKEAD